MKKFALATLLALSTSAAFAGFNGAHSAGRLRRVVTKANSLPLNRRYLPKIIL